VSRSQENCLQQNEIQLAPRREWSPTCPIPTLELHTAEELEVRIFLKGVCYPGGKMPLLLPKKEKHLFTPGRHLSFYICPHQNLCPWEIKKL
jgi:hypothetical protein